jgi:xanthine dehydrogenase accessory factor/xanthine dehydrogenase large subunit
LLAAGEPVALVSVAAAKGSTPRERGARMLVAARTSVGTIGGGRLEHEAINRARALLATGEVLVELDVPLGPAIGQCCGGHVTLSLRRVEATILAELAAEEAAKADILPAVLLFGAGHVGQALASALAPLPFHLTWIDGRADVFPARIPEGVNAVVTERLVAEVEAAPRGAAYLVLTHSHALDFELCASVLERGDFAYLGLIGSRTKRRRFERGFRELGIAPDTVARLVCPIGGNGVRDKRPAVIAALTAAELLAEFLTESAGAAPIRIATPVPGE